MIPVPINVHRARDDGSWAAMELLLGRQRFGSNQCAPPAEAPALKLAPLHQRPCFITASDSTEVGSHCASEPRLPPHTVTDSFG
jgi:hypothetical protein